MAIWLIPFDTKEVLVTCLIAVIVIILGVVFFLYLWLYNPEFEIPQDTHNFHQTYQEDVSFFSKMKLLIMDILNHDYWINKVGFDGYCYLLFLRKFLIILLTYSLIYAIGSLIFYVLEGIMNLGYIKDEVFEKNVTNIYTIMMVFLMTMLVLVGIKNFRREV